MYLDITEWFGQAEPYSLSASAAELGQNAGKITWAAAMQEAETSGLLDTEEKREAAKDFFRGFGAWECSEIEAWTVQHLEALLLQFIAGDMREGGLADDPTEEEWQEYERLCEEGQASGNIMRGDDGRIYFYLGT